MVRNLLILALGMACSGEKAQESVSREASAVGDESFDTGGWADAGTEDSEPSVVPEVWTMSGELYVESGLLLPGRSLVIAEVTDAFGVPICHHRAGLSSTSRIADVPDDDLDVWWTVDLEILDGSTCGASGVAGPLPEGLHLGLGPLHPEVEAVLDSEAGDAPAEDIDTKSIFVSFGDDGDVWVFGLATMKPEPGVVTSDTGRPDHFGIPDGLWRFRAVYPFSY